MANVRNGNTFYIDADSDSGTAASYITEKGIKILGIIWTPTNTTDIVEIFDKASGSAAAGSQKLKLLSATDDTSNFYSFDGCPLLCPNGIWVNITGSPTCTLILQGGGTA